MNAIVMQDDIDAALLPVFLAEADELCPQIAAVLQDRLPDPAQLKRLKRLLHTLKGSARITGAMRIGAVLHRMEEHPADLPALQGELDQVRTLLAALRSGAAATLPVEAAVVPFGQLGERLQRLLRQTADELGKQAELKLFGSELLLERRILERMTAPFEHLLRNAVAHGLEDSALRLEQGKSVVGVVSLLARREGDEIVFELDDDGVGLDLAALYAKAQEKGMSFATPPDEHQLAQLIFVSGISTARKVTEVAGRGVGLDVVRSEVAALGGRVEVVSRSGQGTRFTIRLPSDAAALE